MNKKFDISEQPTITREEIDLAIERAHRMRGEMLLKLIRQFGSWLHRSASAALAWRPSAGNHVLPLNR